MWIEKVTTKSGTTKFKYCEQYIDSMTWKKKRVSVTLEKNNRATKRMAAEALARKIAAAQEPPEPEDITVAEACEKYLAYQKINVKASTYTRLTYQCKNVIQILGRDTLLSRLNAGFIKERLIATNREAATLNWYRVSIIALLNWSFENDCIDDISFLKKIKTFREPPHREKIQDKYLEPEELASLIDALPEKRWRLLTRFLALSGLRFGEAAALNREDIDLENSVIHVTKNFDKQNRITTTPKTSSSYRDVSIQQELKKVCREIILFTKEDGLFRNYRTDLFIASTDGGNIRYAAYYAYLKKHTPESIKKAVTPHILRHTHCSIMAAADVSIDTIARRLGHETDDVTRKIYLHVTKDLAKRDAEQIEHVRILTS